MDRCTPRLIYDRPPGATIVHSVTGCHECSYDRSHAGSHYYSYDRSQDAKTDRTIGRRPSRLIVRSVATIDRTICRRAQLIAHRSLIATTSRRISYDGYFHRYPPIVRDSANTRRDRSPYATAAGDRSKHCRSVAHWPNRNQSYDPEIVRFGVTVALVARRLHVIII